MTNLKSWVDELSAALGIDRAAVDVDRVLEIARDAAHSVARPAAPVTTYLVGLAVGLQGGGSAQLDAAAATAQRLAQAHAGNAAS